MTRAEKRELANLKRKELKDRFVAAARKGLAEEGTSDGATVSLAKELSEWERTHPQEKGLMAEIQGEVTREVAVLLGPVWKAEREAVAKAAQERIEAMLERTKAFKERDPALVEKEEAAISVSRRLFWKLVEEHLGGKAPHPIDAEPRDLTSGSDLGAIPR